MSNYIYSLNKLCVNLLILSMTVFITYTVHAGTPEIVYTYSEFISPGVIKLHAAIRTQNNSVVVWFECYSYGNGTSTTPRQPVMADSGISNVETILSGVPKDVPTYYWSFVTNGTDTVWSGQQTTNSTTPVNSPIYYNFIIDSITTSSYRSQITINPNGYDCTLQFVWGRDDYVSDVRKYVSIPASMNDTVISYMIDDLTPYIIGHTWVSVTNADYNYIGGETRHKSIQTLYDSNAVGLTTAMIVFSEPQGKLGYRNFGVNTYGHYGYDYGLGEKPLPPAAPGIDVRFIGTRLTDGSYIDIKPFYSTTQIDTYKVRIIADPDYYPIKFIWQDLSSKYTGSVIFKTSDESIDMRSVNSYSITNPDIGLVKIIVEGPKPTLFQPSIMATNPTIGSSTEATLESLINPNGSSGNSWFEWGTTEQYGSVSTVQEIPISFLALNVIDTLQGLSPNTEYHFRTVVQTELGKFYGIDQKFQTDNETNISTLEMPNDQFRLFQNYPNPFNPTTTITYQIPILEKVSIKVYTLLGKEIATLIDEKKSPGIYQVTWNADQFPSGVYYYRLIAGLDSRAGKLLLLK